MSNKDSKQIKPRLRFPKFEQTGEWEQDILVNLVETVTPPKKLQTSDYFEQGIFPIIDQSQDNICGWTNDSSSIIKESLPLIIFGDHTCTLKIAREPFAQGADGIKILKTSKKITPVFLFYNLQSNPILMKGYMRYFSTLKEKIITYPNVISGEQQKIADCLSSIDELITVENKKLDTLKIYKKGLMQQLFPAEGETLPKLRFPEFKNASLWDKKRLDEVARFVRERLLLDKISVANYISTENILPNFAGISPSSKLPQAKTATKFKINDILISNIRPYLKKIWFSNMDGGASNDVIIIRSGEIISDIFLSLVLKSDVFVNYIMQGAKGVKMPRGDLSLIKEYPITYPSDKKEQQKIANCLSSIDEVITVVNKKIEALKVHKKSLMQQLFPIMSELQE
ncbi:TPA: restriction endonuclease subunit S [Legionella pneumophila]